MQRVESLTNDALSLAPESFVRDVLASLSRNLENIIGVEEARGFIQLVGEEIGLRIDKDYKEALDVEKFSADQLADVLVDLKDRIGGNFSIESSGENFITLVNTSCPFGARVVGRPSLCMMTSNVFGRIASQSFGEACVQLHETISNGDARCRVVVYYGTSVDEGERYFRIDHRGE